MISVIEDDYLRLFDRRFRVTTSGFIPLEETSIRGPGTYELQRYRGVNAWAFNAALSAAKLNRSLLFADIGCGLGRACIVAARAGFSRVMGIEIVPEFCELARRNVKSYETRIGQPSGIQIVNVDATSYSATADCGIYFLFRPFSGKVLTTVIDNIKASASRQNRSVTLIYSERLVQSNSNVSLFDRDPGLVRKFTLARWGQGFWGYQVPV